MASLILLIPGILFGDYSFEFLINKDGPYFKTECVSEKKKKKYCQQFSYDFTGAEHLLTCVSL